MNEIALFRAQWQYTNKKGLPAAEYERFLEENARPVLRLWQNRAREEQIFQPSVVYGYFRCRAEGNDLAVFDDAATEIARFTFPRQLDRQHRSLADYFRAASADEFDTLALQVVTIGARASERERELLAANEYTDYLHLHGLSVELTEALAELWHQRIRQELGLPAATPTRYAACFRSSTRELRYSFGYPACPDREDDATLARLLRPERIGVVLTEGLMWEPEQSTSALIVHHPQASYFKVV